MIARFQNASLLGLGIIYAVLVIAINEGWMTL